MQGPLGGVHLALLCLLLAAALAGRCLVAGGGCARRVLRSAWTEGAEAAERRCGRRSSSVLRRKWVLLGALRP